MLQFLSISLFLVCSYTHIHKLESCPTGTVQEGKRHTYVVSTATEPWFRAYIICKNIGMELASSKTSAIGGGFWTIGSRHGGCSNDFVWWDSGKPIVYRKFTGPQPDNAGNKEYCIEVYQTNNDLLWNDYVCDIKLRFICQS
ncbi:hypothetical protein GWI33_001651 [Rhynchophorus ferrugineus]|uniref:C-type lectin domain-containing protein n=1 Tax=Rhynchophorus ferrugineus TaxID=354439 RepID=A0A834IL29_RHYFE|nr:hypothetical protein GWI33_001651 [Rhynchophorus ferrugineus]